MIFPGTSMKSPNAISGSGYKVLYWILKRENIFVMFVKFLQSLKSKPQFPLICHVSHIYDIVGEQLVKTKELD